MTSLKLFSLCVERLMIQMGHLTSPYSVVIKRPSIGESCMIQKWVKVVLLYFDIGNERVNVNPGLGFCAWMVLG